MIVHVGLRIDSSQRRLIVSGRTAGWSPSCSRTGSPGQFADATRRPASADSDICRVPGAAATRKERRRGCQSPDPGQRRRRQSFDGRRQKSCRTPVLPAVSSGPPRRAFRSTAWCDPCGCLSPQRAARRLTAVHSILRSIFLRLDNRQRSGRIFHGQADVESDRRIGRVLRQSPARWARDRSRPRLERRTGTPGLVLPRRSIPSPASDGPATRRNRSSSWPDLPARDGKIFGQGVADSHVQRAVHLAIEMHGIDHTPDVMRGDHFRQRPVVRRESPLEWRIRKSDAFLARPACRRHSPTCWCSHKSTRRGIRVRQARQRRCPRRVRLARLHPLRRSRCRPAPWLGWRSSGRSSSFRRYLSKPSNSSGGSPVASTAN